MNTPQISMTWERDDQFTDKLVKHLDSILIHLICSSLSQSDCVKQKESVFLFQPTNQDSCVCVWLFTFIYPFCGLIPWLSGIHFILATLSFETFSAKWFIVWQFLQYLIYFSSISLLRDATSGRDNFFLHTFTCLPLNLFNRYSHWKRYQSEMIWFAKSQRKR